MTEPRTDGPVQRSIRDALIDQLTPHHLEVINESHMHSGPPGRESHFKVVVVTEQFDGKNRIKRHQAVNRACKPMFDDGLHALAIHTWTPGEWTDRGGVVPDSPLCKGGSKGS
jgi:BolA protein